MANCPGPRDIMSLALAHTATYSRLDPIMLRSQFSDLVVPVVKAPAGVHSHPVAAAGRSTGSLLIDRYGRLLGLSPYFIQCSKADLRNWRAGSRSYYWTKDIGIPTSIFKPEEDSVLALVDVDHYIDMPALLVENFLPTLIYTFQPHQVARTTANYSFTFCASGEVRYNLTGGGMFVHYVWNYGPDHCMVTKTCFGIPYSAASYLIDRRAMDLDHEMILLTPTAKWTGVMAIVASWLASRSLERLDPVVGPFTRMEIFSLEGVKVSTGQVGYYAQATIPAASDNAIQIIARTSQLKLTTPQVMSFTDGDREAAAVLLEYHRAQIPHKAPCVYPLGESVLKYQFSPLSYDPSAKPSLHAFMHPIIHAAYCPDMTVSNEEQCIKGRLTDVRSGATMTPFLNTVMNQFVDQFILHPFNHDPVDEEELYERQNRPAQRRMLEEAANSIPDRTGQMFMKKEAYAGPKDPRPITTINGVDKAAYSKYVYALADHIKAQPWYAFAKAPKDIAQRVVDVLEHAHMAVPTDFSRFDGHYSQVLRELEQMILIRFFRRQYHADLLDLHRAQYHLKVYGAFGTDYETEYARGSGSPETAAMNTIANAFVAFLALRMTRIDGAFLDPATAYRKLGIYGGDDGLTADVDPEKYIAAAKLVGQELTISSVKRGLAGIKFLARVYGPEVWFGSPNSCCDLPRQLSKLHVTVALPPKVTPVIKLVEKARAFYLTDSNTPVIGWFCTRVLQLSGDEPCTRFLRIWSNEVALEEQYPNGPATWYEDYAMEALPQFDFKAFADWLKTTTNVQDLLRPPLCHPFVPATPAVDVVVNGELWNAIAPVKSENAIVPVQHKKPKPSTVIVKREDSAEPGQRRPRSRTRSKRADKPKEGTPRVNRGQDKDKPKEPPKQDPKPKEKPKKQKKTPVAEEPKQVSSLPKSNGKTIVRSKSKKTTPSGGPPQP